jgi:hypothetical protein
MLTIASNVILKCTLEGGWGREGITVLFFNFLSFSDRYIRSSQCKKIIQMKTTDTTLNNMQLVWF